MSLYKHLFFLCLCFLSLKLEAQSTNFEWVTPTGGASVAYAQDLATDYAGNVYSVGFFDGTIDFDPSTSVQNETASGPRDLYIQKLDASGNFLWAKALGGSSWDRATSIAIDSSNNIYIIGFFEGTVDFDPSTNTVNKTSNGGGDAYLLKLDASGNFIWVNTWGGSDDDKAFNVLVKDDELFIAGSYRTTVNFNPNGVAVNKTSNGSNDAYLLKLDTTGSFLWVQSWGGSGNDVSYQVDVDGMGNAYCTGHFSNSVDFNPGAGSSNSSSNGSTDLYVLKLDPNGSWVWDQTVGGSGIESGSSIIVNDLGETYVCGYYQNIVDFDPGAAVVNDTAIGSRDFCLLKFNANSSFEWVHTMGSVNNDYGIDLVKGIDESIYMTASFFDTVLYKTATDSITLSSAGSRDFMIQKLDSTDQIVWTKIIGGTASESSEAITLGLNNSIYTTGTLLGPGTTDFDPPTGNSIYTPSSSNSDFFVHKMLECFPTTGTDVITTCGSHTWIDGVTYTSSNNSATFTLSNSANCDSVVTLDLTINSPTIGTDVITACGSHTWIDGVTYTSSNNSATFTLSNSANCDSIVTLDLTINIPTTGTDVITACGSHTWIDGVTYTSSNNSATFTLSNSANCDSLVTLHLTINNPTTGTDVITACGSHTWIDGVTYTSSNNSATFTLSNSANCDSLVTLNLTIENIDTSLTLNNNILTAVENNAIAYQWLDCDDNYSIINGATNQSFEATQNGYYALVLSTNSCVDTSNCVNITTVGVESFSRYSKISPYPNPTDGRVHLDLGDLTDVQVLVYNLQSKLVYQDFVNQQGQYSFDLDLPAACYILKIVSKQQLLEYKLIKQ